MRVRGSAVQRVPLLLQETTGGTTTKYLTGAGGLPVEQQNGTGAPQYYVQDQQGSTRALLDSTGTALSTFTYDPYGNLTRSSGTATTPFQYAGQYTDSESGLQYLRARYYDPSTEQFLTLDPLVGITGEPYAYTAGNPLNSGDPSGLCQAGPINLPFGSSNDCSDDIGQGSREAAIGGLTGTADWIGTTRGDLTSGDPGRVARGAFSVYMNVGLAAAVPEERAGIEACSQMDRVGTALEKSDVYHRATSWVVDDPAAQHFPTTGRDGVTRDLYQLPGEVNGEPGVFEWMVDRTGGRPVITHQRFKRGADVTGVPN